MKRLKDFWLHLSIKVKLLSYFFIVISMISLFNLYLNNNNYTITDQFDSSMTTYFQINQLLVHIQENEALVTSYLHELNQEDKASYDMRKVQIAELIGSLEKRFTTLDAYFVLRAIKNSSNSMYAKWDLAIEQRDNRMDSYFNAYYAGENIQTYIEGYIEQLLYISLKEGSTLYNKLAEEASLMRQISLVLIVISMLIAMFIGFLFVSTFINPINKLVKASKLIAAGELDIEEVPLESKDEVGILADSFNIMSRNIRSYVNDLKEKVVIEKKLHEEELEVIHMEQLLKVSQFEALQSQINPHFLFNTLNTISRTAMFEGANDTLKLIQALSNLFRFKLRNQSSVIPLSEELWIAEEYIYLQQFRFKERLNYIICVDESCKSVQVPIFMLQPLIENAIIHGIEPKVEGGTLRIKLFSRMVDGKERITLRITDTGVGMKKSILEEILEFSEKKHHSIGVSNVYHRFKMMFHDGSSFRMMSKEGLGTCVEFKFQRNE